MSLGTRDILNKGRLLSGTSACPGCPENITMRLVSTALGKDAVFIVVAGCSSIIQGIGPNSVYNYPVLNIAFAAGPSAASGMARAFKMRGKKVKPVVWAGDGGTADIGFASLSGAAERNENILYICVDNEAYMNTGGHRSGSTPLGAKTPTTPAGKKENKKDLPLIMIAHHVPYVATASVGYPHDLMNKIAKAKDKDGFSYVQVLCPDPYGWLFDPSKTAELGKLAVQTCYWPLIEYNEGKLEISPESLHCLDIRTRKPVKEFLKMQGRYRNVPDETVKELEDYIDKMWIRFKELYEGKISI
ncbi:pyruvate synthase subunit PorB [Acidianus manzaensis]|uniref:2-oxoacid oxidoreductase (ferredoxin) n=1 Tax=Acidianus manzaensis TaxID=282676 RepID=A0A1W6JWW2_9CREN|nr:pyruvate synthase subunit PorB [Acidianus manzaensis]ARM74729.1 2-ketoisovalerate ferredoxin oxidoreductase [Acidianus manzaensis]